MDLQIAGKIALISGASGGIGRETTKILAQEGAQTIIVARRESLLQELADEITEAGGLPPFIVVEDLTDRTSFARVEKKVLAEFDCVDILVNNLGQARPFEIHTPDEDWDTAYELNFTQKRKLAEIFIDGMIERQFGRIINLTSTTEPLHVSGSQTAKAAIVIWAKGLSRLVAKHGITVNCVTPGWLLTDQIRNHYIPKTMPTKEDQERAFRYELPAGRFGEPSDASQLIAFLCSPKAGYITGQRIYVDGGKVRHI